MVNIYGYNRKTKEEDDTILTAVKCHHDAVAAKGYLVVMTSLVGSQNYDLDDELSDIDTYSLVYPPILDIANAKDPYCGMFELKDGHCNIKDVRLALNLLKKTSPNSAEYFTSKYKIYNPIFEPSLKAYLDNNDRLYYMIHCNYHHMLSSIAGMAKQMSKRNMTAGKRYCHAIRMDNMMYHYLNSPNASSILDMRAGGDRDLAMIVKRDLSAENNIEYEQQCKQIADKLTIIKDNFVLSEEQNRAQQVGDSLINSFQWRLFKTYLEEVNK